MSRYFRAGKVPAEGAKRRTHTRQRQEQARARFGEVPGGVILRGWRRFGRLGETVFWELP